MTKEELKNQITELKENCKKLAEEYRERYNQDNEDKIALNMFYHNVISYNDYESVLALIENRNSTIMCFSAPPVLTEETVEVNLKRIAELEKENTELKKTYRKQRNKRIDELQKENAELKEKLEIEQNARGDWFGKAVTKDSQLTKAKELLERLLITSCNSDVLNLLPNCSEVLRVRVEAEQFISEVEK